ncbi:MAG: mannonate dehydratase [Clostridia bacterium]|nr:mannonate dehydratase [Clostridia bacterium]
MILTDYYRSTPDATWEIGRQLGIRYGTIRLPEDADFDLTNAAHWIQVYDRFMDAGIRPIIIEPMPNTVHDHIKSGDEKRDESIEQVLQMLPIMDRLNIRTICFNFMACVGWTRTAADLLERGGAHVTGFDLEKYKPSSEKITAEQLWQNYAYFLRAVLPVAEKFRIRLALHPDDPPLPSLGQVERVMISYENICKAVREIYESPSLGVTFCQATFHLMGEAMNRIIPELKDKIFFIHFRNTTGVKTHFRETFHDNGDLPMAELMRLYVQNGINVPVRVDHVPTMLGERTQTAGYDALGRLYAIGYLRGIMETLDCLDDA